MWSIIILLITLIALSFGGLFYYRRRRPTALPTFESLVDISSQGHYAMFVEGSAMAPEFFQDKRLIRLALFTLVPQATEFDHEAVNVFFGPHLVGHLSRSDAQAYRLEYGSVSTKCRGIHQSGGVEHQVWLDVNVGSGLLGASSILQTPQLWDLFEMPCRIPSERLEVVRDFLANNMVRICDATLLPGDQRVDVIVDGLSMAVLLPQVSMEYLSSLGQAPREALVLLRRTAEGPSIHLMLNPTLRQLLPQSTP